MSGLILNSAYPADRHPALVYVARLAASSRITMARSLHVVAGILTDDACRDAQMIDWGSLRYQHVAAIRTVLAERFAPSTANRHLSALRGVIKEAWRLKHMNAEEYRATIDVPGIKGETLPAGRAIPAGELRVLFAACNDGTNSGIRDAALLAILYGAGPRRSEVVNINLSDFDAETGELRILRGKGNKDRVVYATNGSAVALARWLDIRGDAAGALFCPVNRGGRVTVRRMTSQAVLFVCKKRAEAAGIPEFSPHDLRRSCASDLLDAGADISVVSKLLGHASVQTTARYDRRDDRAKKRAVELLHIPI